MNSKFFFLCILLFIFNSCGVKAPPLKYPETVIDSYIHSYTGSDQTPEELARTKNKQSLEPAKTPTLLPQP